MLLGINHVIPLIFAACILLCPMHNSLSHYAPHPATHNSLYTEPPLNFGLLFHVPKSPNVVCSFVDMVSIDKGMEVYLRFCLFVCLGKERL